MTDVCSAVCGNFRFEAASWTDVHNLICETGKEKGLKFLCAAMENVEEEYGSNFVLGNLLQQNYRKFFFHKQMGLFIKCVPYTTSVEILSLYSKVLGVKEIPLKAKQVEPKKVESIVGTKRSREEGSIESSQKVQKVENNESNASTVPVNEEVTKGLNHQVIIIQVNGLKDEKFTLKIFSDESIRFLKQAILKVSGIPLIYQRLVCNGVSIYGDYSTLAENNIKSGSCINVLPNSIGGMYHPVSGFNDNEGEFEYSTIQVNDKDLIVHPSWDLRTFRENVQECIDSVNPCLELAKKFRKTALAMKREEIARREARVREEIDRLKKERLNIHLMEEYCIRDYEDELSDEDE